MTSLLKLIDKRRAAEAVLYGINVEIAVALGEREDAQHWMRLMNAATIARQAARADCYFDEQGADDRKRVAG